MSELSSSTKTIDQTALDQLWNFTDPMLSAERFRRAADDAEYSDEAQAELMTQLARALGLANKFEDADAVLNAVVSDSPVVAARVGLERGRIRVRQGATDEAVSLFTRAARDAASGGVTFLILDALHMLALTDVGHEEEWAADGLELLSTATQERTQRWGVALNNNLAWYLHDNDRAEEALNYFVRALDAAKSFGTARQRFQARWAIGRCLRTLGRLDEALELQRALDKQRPDDRFVQQELAELSALLAPQSDATVRNEAEAEVEAGTDSADHAEAEVEPSADVALEGTLDPIEVDNSDDSGEAVEPEQSVSAQTVSESAPTIKE